MSKRRRALIETFESRIMYSAVLSGAEQQVADTGAAVQHGGSELVFIDARVPDVQSLLDDLAAHPAACRSGCRGGGGRCRSGRHRRHRFDPCRA